jgi:hypothetical protein
MPGQHIVIDYAISEQHKIQNICITFNIYIYVISQQHKMSKLAIVYCEEIVIRYLLSATHNTTIIPFVDSTK